MDAVKEKLTRRSRLRSERLEGKVESILLEINYETGSWKEISAESSSSAPLTRYAGTSKLIGRQRMRQFTPDTLKCYFSISTPPLLSLFVSQAPFFKLVRSGQQPLKLTSLSLSKHSAASAAPALTQFVLQRYHQLVFLAL
eukprot:749183-Hanusia_phi.AAC.9